MGQTPHVCLVINTPRQSSASLLLTTHCLKHKQQGRCCIVLPVLHIAILPILDIAILPVLHTAILPFVLVAILPVLHTAILPYLQYLYYLQYLSDVCQGFQRCIIGISLGPA